MMKIPNIKRYCCIRKRRSITNVKYGIADNSNEMVAQITYIDNLMRPITNFTCRVTDNSINKCR